MCVEGSQPIVHLGGALKRGVLAKKKGISSACDRLRPPATVCDRGYPPPCNTLVTVSIRRTLVLLLWLIPGCCCEFPRGCCAVRQGCCELL